MDTITQLVLKIGVVFLQLLPAWVIRWMTYYILVFTGYRKQVINKNYKETSVGKLTIDSDSSFYKKNMRHLSRIITESIKPLRKKSIAKITFHHIQNLESECHKTGGLILLASHYGNWELGCTLLPLQTNIPAYGVYKPLKNKAVDQFLLDKRSKHGLILVPLNKIARIIHENKKENKPAIYILISDQNPNSKNSVIWADFLGIKTAYFNGPLKLFQKYKFNVAYMQMSVGPSLFDYSVSFDTVIDTSDNGDNLTQSYSDILESQISKHPEYWLWSHKRWKRTFLNKK